MKKAREIKGQARKLLKEICTEIEQLDPILFIPQEFCLCSVYVTNVRKAGHDKTVADVNIEFSKRSSTKDPITAKKYWSGSMSPTLLHIKRPNFQKATNALELQQDLRRNFPQESIKNIYEGLENLLEKYVLLEGIKPSQDTFSYPISHVKADNTLPSGFNNLLISNIRKPIFLDAKKRKDIDTHDLEGKFEQGITYQFHKIRQITLE